MRPRRNHEGIFRPSRQHRSSGRVERDHERPPAGLIGGHFDVFVTIDQNIRHQQNLAGLPFAIVIVSVPDNTLTSYLPLFDQMLRTIEAARPGDISVIP